MKSAPWHKFYGDIPTTLTYPEKTLYQVAQSTASKYPEMFAYEFLGKRTKYSEFLARVDLIASSFAAIGVKKGDRVTIAMPNSPQGVDAFYALNKIGAIANMIHPLSAPGEIEFYLNFSESKAILTLDQFVPKITEILPNLKQHTKIIVARISDSLPLIEATAIKLLKERKYPSLPNDDRYITWRKFIEAGKTHGNVSECKQNYRDGAVILYSGGTTGTTKGILLSSHNFNATAMQTATASGYNIHGFKILAVMPIFHGFGLGVSIHTAIMNSCEAILMPRFTLKSYAKQLKEKRPNFIAGVPTLYEALLRSKDLEKADLSFLKGMFSGGDSLSIELKRKVDTFLKERGATIQVREGYGSTESVTASCLTPVDYYREGSIGIPYPDMYFKIVKPGTTEEVEVGTEGEICVSGPTLMLEYINNPQETAATIQTHSDGERWLHSGDLGKIDEDGFVYFLQRIKRMIISSGYNVYPSQIENVIDSHEKVLLSCAIGVPDPYKKQKIKAFVVLRPEFKGQEDQVRAELQAYCEKNIAKYALPYEYEFRAELPKTLVGKVAYRKLEEEEGGKA